MRAGFFEKDVTPPVGAYLAGYPSRNEPSQGADDPLYLRIVALEDDAGERLVLVTADLLKFPRDMAWRTKVWCQRTHGLRSPLVIVNLSHTHSAPALFLQRCYPQWPLNLDYVNALEQSIRDGISAALADLRPMRVQYGLHQAHFGISRRLPQPENGGRVVLSPNPDGYYDPDLPVFTFSEGDELKAVLYSYACHPTSKATLNISADWPGLVSRGLKQELGDDVLTFFVQGAGASIMPRCPQRDGQEEYERYWRAAAGDIAAFVGSATMRAVDLQLHGLEKEFELPYDLTRVPSEEALLELANPAESPVPAAFRPANRSILRQWARDLLEQVRTDSVATGFRMHLGKVRLTDSLQLFTLSGEVTAEVGRLVKDLYPERQTLFFGYCSYTDAYIPTAAVLPEGGHEALGSVFFHDRPAPFTAEIDEILKREVLSLRV